MVSINKTYDFGFGMEEAFSVEAGAADFFTKVERGISSSLDSLWLHKDGEFIRDGVGWRKREGVKSEGGYQTMKAYNTKGRDNMIMRVQQDY